MVVFIATMLKCACPKVALTGITVFGTDRRLQSLMKRGIPSLRIISSAAKTAQVSSIKMENVMISIFFLLGFVVILWQLQSIRRKLAKTEQLQNEIKFGLAAINESLADASQHQGQVEANIVKAFNEICQALNTYFATAGAYMNHSSFALQNIAVCMIPFIDDIKESALEEENYEKVQECINIINNLKEIIKS